MADSHDRKESVSIKSRRTLDGQSSVVRETLERSRTVVQEMIDEGMRVEPTRRDLAEIEQLLSTIAVTKTVSSDRIWHDPPHDFQIIFDILRPLGMR